ncbi:MAG: hypothetical protein ACXVZR_07310 [Terriglobales bacterium]
MSQVHRYECEVCGSQERDHTNWLLVSDEPRARNIDILNWDDKLAAQPGICHVCCTDHLQVLVGRWMMPDLGIRQNAEAQADAETSASLREFSLERACLSSSMETDRESLLAMLDAVEIVLKGSGVTEEEDTSVFDA